MAIESITFKNDKKIGQAPSKQHNENNKYNQPSHKMIENPNFVIIDDKTLDAGNKLL